jgi:hypothetical protein
LGLKVTGAVFNEVAYMVTKCDILRYECVASVTVKGSTRMINNRLPMQTLGFGHKFSRSSMCNSSYLV